MKNERMKGAVVDYPRRSPHAILHTPLSVVRSTLLHYAGTAYKRRVVRRPATLLSVQGLPSRNTDKHRSSVAGLRATRGKIALFLAE